MTGSPHSQEVGEVEADQKRRTPLPVGQISILLFLRFCESASTFVIFPFLNELLASITGDSVKVGYYAGLMESIRQLLSLVSVMFWSRMSDQIGRKPILLLGTFALAVSTSSFGLSKTFWSLVVSRCIFTAFNSNAGVIKSMVGEITDHSNSADAFALLHVPWAAGSSFGALMGGSLARPHDHFSGIFQADFWIKYPYFLPCVAMSLIALFACWLIAVYLNETVKSGTLYKRIGSKDDETEPLISGGKDTNNEPVPFSSLLHVKVMIPIMSYVCIASLHASSNAIQPLFLAMPVDIGGLGLPPREVGYILGAYGITNTIFQTLMLGRLVRRFGVKNVFVTAIAAFIPVFTFSPLMNILVRAWGVSYSLWFMLACQLSCSLVMELGYGCVYIFITAAAPNKRSLGSTNGLAQTLVSIGRIVTPLMTSSLLSLSIQNNLLHGYAVYVVLVALAGGAICLASRLPRRLE